MPRWNIYPFNIKFASFEDHMNIPYLPSRRRVGHDHCAHLRLAILGHEHVLGAAQADSLGPELTGAPRVLGGVGVGPYPQAPGLVGPLQHLFEVCVDLGLDQRHVVDGHLALGPVDRDRVALVQARSVADTVRALRSITSAWAPTTAGRPIPRATSAACDALPPSEVRIPLAAWKPATSSASVNGRTRITSRPSWAAWTASAAVNTIAPLAAPGEALTPEASTS